MIKTTLLALTAAAGLTIAAQAQGYFYGDVDVYHHGSITVYNQPSAAEEMWTYQQEIKMYADEFRGKWYTLNSTARTFVLLTTPGLAEAIHNNDWANACQLTGEAARAEQAYEKYYHKLSPAYIAAYRALGSTVSAHAKRKQ